jgi:hypothetical protein
MIVVVVVVMIDVIYYGVHDECKLDEVRKSLVFATSSIHY